MVTFIRYNMPNPVSRIIGFFAIINQSECGVRLTLGKSSGIKQPGFHIKMPFLHKMYRIDLRERVDRINRQTLISKDNVTFYVDGCIQWRIKDPQKAFFNVSAVDISIIEVAKIEMRNLLSSIDINDLLHHRGEMSKAVLENIKYVEDRWGVEVTRVELMDIQFDDSMTRAMAVKAEADRNAEAKIINAKADVETAKLYKEASEVYMDNPVSMRLREYQLWQTVSHNPSTTIYVVPSAITDYLGSMQDPSSRPVKPTPQSRARQEGDST